MSIIKEIVAAVRTILLKRKIAQETKNIVLQVKGRADYGYPFASNDGLYSKNGLYDVRLEGSIKLRNSLQSLDTACGKMPEQEANALLYLAQRDLEERIHVYLKHAKAHQPAVLPAMQPTVATA